VDETRAKSDGVIPARFAWLGYGLVGGIVVAGLTMTRLVVVKSQRLAAEMVDNVPRPPSFDWSEILRISALMFLMGFACGAIVRVSRRLSIRYGAVGDVLIGVIVLGSFFLMCIVAFDPDVLTRGWRILAPLFGMSTFLGVIGGFFGGREIRKEMASAGAKGE
jgi:putative copper export protein